jgi:hypothetical protein
MGITEESFLYSVFPSFRYTMYVTKKSATVKGRLKLNESLFSSHTTHKNIDIINEADNVVVLDRLGSGGLSDIFSTCMEKAIHSLSTTFAFSHYSNPSINLSYIALPTVSATLSILSSMPTISQLESRNKDLHMKYNKDYDEEYGRLLLLVLLNFFERINIISFWIPGNSVDGTHHGKNLHLYDT